MHGNKLFPFQIDSIQIGTEKQNTYIILSRFIFDLLSSRVCLERVKMNET